MIKSSLFLLAATLFTGAAARADVSWQHRGRISLGAGKNAQTLATFDFSNSWSGANHRALLQYDASGMSDASMLMGAPQMGGAMASGELNYIERLDDDRLIVAVPSAQTYVDEPFSTLRERTRLNIWAGLAPELNKDEVPELTPEQRERLGAEVRALYSPFTRRLTRTYFRELPNRRTIKGLNCRGYRFTQLVNLSGKPGGTNWANLSAEWWLADRLPGDATIADFTRRANEIKAAGGPPTKSMWLNETFPVLWQIAPPELHRALQSVIGYENSDSYGFQGTPAQFFVTLSAPKSNDPATSGQSVRFALELQSRSETPVAPSVFAAPGGLKRQPIEPFLQLAQNGIRQLNQSINKALDAQLGAQQAPQTPAVIR